jgi:hypothetical protein
MSHVVTVPELLDGHTVLDVECLDRIYLNGYVPALQVGGQVFTFLHDHRGMPVASPAVFGQIGGRFRQAVARFAEMNDIPLDAAHASAAAAIRNQTGVSVANAHLGAVIQSAPADQITVVTSDPGDMRLVAGDRKITVTAI